MKALILDGKVVDVVEKEFEVHSSMSWVDCDDKVAVGWTYDGKTFKTNQVTLTAEQKLDRVRIERNKLLKSSDWTQGRDVTLSNDADWKTYRQELRDLTKTYKTLDDVKWPTEPS
tara:strand:+ start:1135 stop:1479 length:345 start_codon:yes stop_codon:yes gene_type:complete